MPTKKHYFIEENANGKFAVRAKGSTRASVLVETQGEAIRLAKQFNPEDHPDVERVQKREKGPDKWRSASR
ncbi:MAG TPA: DUF2188 domain-containing protein [Candidatus Sulfotelmatobacter sp.]